MFSGALQFTAKTSVELLSRRSSRIVRLRADPGIVDEAVDAPEPFDHGFHPGRMRLPIGRLVMRGVQAQLVPMRDDLA